MNVEVEVLVVVVEVVLVVELVVVEGVKVARNPIY